MNNREQEEAIELTKLALETPITQESDLANVMKTLNEDIYEKESGLSSIDMKTRLHPLEVVSMVIHDTVVGLNCLPRECLMTTRTKKRLAVSLLGKGREEVVKIVQGEREHSKESTGFGAKMKNLFTPQG